MTIGDKKSEIIYIHTSVIFFYPDEKIKNYKTAELLLSNFFAYFKITTP